MEINKQLLFNGLMVTVAAPYLYSLSEREKGYFKFGLKLLAGTVVGINLIPLLQASAPLVEAAQLLQESKLKQAQALASKTIEGEKV